MWSENTRMILVEELSFHDSDILLAYRLLQMILLLMCLTIFNLRDNSGK